jgi:hypothetical protein
MKTDIYPRRPDSAVRAPEPIESPIPQVLIPEVRQHARRRRLRNLAAVLISGATAAGLLLFLGSGSPAGSRASRPSSPSASGATHTERVTEACNKAAPRGPHAWPVLTAGQAVVSDARGRYMAVVYHPTGSRVFACITNGSGGTATEDSSFGQGGIPKPGADEITNAGGGAGAAPGFAGGNTNQPLSQHRDESSARGQRLQRVVSRGVESNVFGMAGNDVSAVTFDFTDGLTVDATIQNGWYFAWWPTLDQPTSVQITTTSGQTQTEKCSSPSQSGSRPPC